MQYKGVVRWESAKPVQAALHTQIPEAFNGHYVISVSGIPIIARGRQNPDDPDSEVAISKAPSEGVLDTIKGVTYLQPKGKSPVQPGVVQAAPGGTGATKTLLFGFSRELLPLGPEDKEVTFTTELGRMEVKAKFNLKDMMYHKELAL